jgi:hypothetical protein
MPQDPELLKIIEQILHDPMLLMKLSDRVYQCIQKNYQHDYDHKIW